MGPPQTEEALREAIALGADKALLLTDRAFAGADTWATSRVLAEAIRRTGPFDLILAGEKATDGETGQVGPEVAAMLDLPFSTYVSALERISSTEIRVRRTIEEGYQYQILSFPCLLTVLSDLNEPSMPTLAGKKKARRFSLETAGNETLDLPKEDWGSRVPHAGDTHLLSEDHPQHGAFQRQPPRRGHRARGDASQGTGTSLEKGGENHADRNDENSLGHFRPR
jgi:electron transfer flavoprotein beta subunit